MLAAFPFDEFSQFTDARKIIEIFNFYHYIVVSLGIEQLGGIAFANFDEEIDIIFHKLNIEPSEQTFTMLDACVGSFLKSVNDARDRNGQVKFYLSLNIGLSTGEIGRFVISLFWRNFKNSTYIRPNIIFKVKNGVNHQPENINHDLFEQAIEVYMQKNDSDLFIM